jgi:outer membrane protein TolC
MKRPPLHTRPAWPALTLVSALALSGCASVNIDDTLLRTNQDAQAFTDGQLVLRRSSDAAQSAASVTQRLLQSPLQSVDAVQLALANSPALQAMLAQSWADASLAAQSGRIANPLFAFERMRLGDELELGRLLSVGLLDLLTLPKRYATAQLRMQAAQVRLTSDVVAHVTQVRQAWVRAVAAQQHAIYAQQVVDSADASADLARRMQAVGNFSKLQRARQHAFYADAQTQFAMADHAATAAREALVRLLGLTDSQASQLSLPERLPDLPVAALTPDEVGKHASRTRLDVRMAQAQLDSHASAQGLTLLTNLTDIELGARRDTVWDAGDRGTRRGYEVSVRLPLFDSGGAYRDAMNAQTLAASQTLEATMRAAGSHLRESYSAYRVAFEIAKHQRDEVLPLRKVIADENLLRYNGMLIGVFELLADAREQVAAVMATLQAQEQFWLADAALQSAVIGRPQTMGMTMPASNATAGNDGAAH